MFWNGTSFQQTLLSVKEELGAQSPRTSVSAKWNSIGARCRIFLHGNELVKLGPINGPTDVVRSLLNISKDILVLVMSRAFDTCLENGTPILTKLST